MNIQKNDQVTVIAGNAEGKTGKILKVYPSNGRVIVEGVNIIKRHSRPNQKNPQGGIVQKEAPIHGSNVMVNCPKCGKPARIGFKKVQDTVSNRMKTMRVCKKCEEMF